MDVDAIRAWDEETVQKYKKGLCFRCGKPGHFSKGCRNPFLKKEGKKPESKKREVSAKIEEIPDPDEEPTVGAVSAQDF